MAGCTALESFLQNSQASEQLAIRKRLLRMVDEDTAALIDFYKESLPLIEQYLWSKGAGDDLLAAYQAVFRELEELIARSGHDRRHQIILFIPVADRPLHLRDCLNSLLKLCQLYNYGGYRDGRFQKIRVVIGDDSRDPQSIEQHKLIASQFSDEGIRCEYFGQQEQLQQLARLDAAERQALRGVIGDVDPGAFYHKGSPRMRNIASLRLWEMAGDFQRVLFFSLDSDQEFRLKLSTEAGEREPYALNYFYYLDEIFDNTDTCILTGKVVGDPPVSPAVMAGNFLEDVSHFLQRVSVMEPRQACQFHSNGKQHTDDAAYHDMAEMFGFKRALDSRDYACPISAKHDNGCCFAHFAGRVNAFFYGEHPTRKTYYEYSAASDSLGTARTVYPGNYVFNKEGLNYFIPFAPLKLRMNGPVMGRVVKALLQERFVSANLPMLHKRTVQDTGRSEFRPDIHQQAMRIDLSGEFERQYFGDVMLFSMERLTSLGYPGRQLSRDSVSLTVNETEQLLQQQYLDKHEEIMARLARFRELLDGPRHWWNRTDDHAQAVSGFRAFADNIEHNFGDDSYCHGLIVSASDKRGRLTQIINAIMQYPAEQKFWQQMMNEKHTV